MKRICCGVRWRIMPLLSEFFQGGTGVFFRRGVGWGGGGAALALPEGFFSGWDGIVFPAGSGVGAYRVLPAPRRWPPGLKARKPPVSISAGIAKSHKERTANTIATNRRVSVAIKL